MLCYDILGQKSGWAQHCTAQGQNESVAALVWSTWEEITLASFRGLAEFSATNRELPVSPLAVGWCSPLKLATVPPSRKLVLRGGGDNESWVYIISVLHFALSFLCIAGECLPHLRFM